MAGSLHTSTQPSAANLWSTSASSTTHAFAKQMQSARLVVLWIVLAQRTPVCPTKAQRHVGIVHLSIRCCMAMLALATHGSSEDLTSLLDAGSVDWQVRDQLKRWL